MASALQIDPGPGDDVRPARLSLEQYHQMIDAGILADGDPIELIDGLLVLKDRGTEGDERLTHGTRHAQVVRFLTAQQGQVEKLGCQLQIQLPISLAPRSEPEPDACIVRGPLDVYRTRHPGPGDLLVVFEVADRSRRFDRGTKQRLYAASGVPLNVVIDLPFDVVEVYRHPGPGGYGSRAEHRAPEVVVVPLGVGALELAVSELLPPR